MSARVLHDTLSLADAGARTWDVLVVGAGPAGALAAAGLARAGLATLLVERARLPRDKVCGGCLDPRALASLREAGLGALPAEAGAVPLARVRLAAGGRVAHLPLAGGAALARAALDAALAGAACARGAELLTGTLAVQEPLLPGAAARAVALRRGEHAVRAQARVVLVADGLAGRFLGEHGATVAPMSRLGAGTWLQGAPADYAEGEVSLACGAEGYVGLVRVEGGALDVAAALAAPALAAATAHGGGAGALAEALLARAGLPPVPGLRAARWHGTPALTRTPRRRAAERAFVLGDACGYVEPFTGQGIGWALASAVAVVPYACAAARRWDGALQAGWEREWRRVVARRQLPCRALAALLRHPRAVALAVRALAVRPGLATPVLARLGARS